MLSRSQVPPVHDCCTAQTMCGDRVGQPIPGTTCTKPPAHARRCAPWGRARRTRTRRRSPRPPLGSLRAASGPVRPSGGGIGKRVARFVHRRRRPRTGRVAARRSDTLGHWRTLGVARRCPPLAVGTIPHPIAVRVASGAGANCCWVSGCAMGGLGGFGIARGDRERRWGGLCAAPVVLAKKDAKATKAGQKATARVVKTNTATSPVDRFGSFVRPCVSPSERSTRTCVGRPTCLIRAA